MSEPYSLLVKVPVDAAKLAAALGSPVMPAAAFDDWAALGHAPMPADLAVPPPSTPLRYLRELRDASLPEYGWHFAHDTATGFVTCVCLLWTERPAEIIAGLNVLRQLFASGGDGRVGFILVHGTVFPALGTLCGVRIAGGHSQMLPAHDAQLAQAQAHLLPIGQALLDQANSLFAREDRAAAAQKLMVDQLDAVAGK